MIRRLAAPLLLAVLRFGQGLGLGGEWGGAILLATENAPPGKRAWYGMFPQLGAPIGFFMSGSIFLLISQTLSDADFFHYGWRIPFLASSLLVIGELLAEKAQLMGLKSVDAVVKGVGSGRESAIRAFIAKGVEITSIKDKTPVPHNGPRPKKPRRI